MDESEKVANDYLVHLGFRTVVYEPDGKVPPDLLADGRIAVEVRRLNQNELTESGYCGLEETRIPLQMTIRKLLASLGPAKSGASWFVHYTLRRPFLHEHSFCPSYGNGLKRFEMIREMISLLPLQ